MVINRNGYRRGIVRPASEMMLVHCCKALRRAFARRAYGWRAACDQSLWAILATHAPGPDTDTSSGDNLPAMSSARIKSWEFAPHHRLLAYRDSKESSPTEPNRSNSSGSVRNATR